MQYGITYWLVYESPIPMGLWVRGARPWCTACWVSFSLFQREDAQYDAQSHEYSIPVKVVSGTEARRLGAASGHDK